MAEPIRIRAVANDGVTEVRVLAPHLMESGQRRDGAGNAIAAHHITELWATHQDKVVLKVRMGGGMSTNPYLVFTFKGGETGDAVTVGWVDNKGERRTDQVLIR